MCVDGHPNGVIGGGPICPSSFEGVGYFPLVSHPAMVYGGGVGEMEWNG
jgi:hypothetical protein